MDVIAGFCKVSYIPSKPCPFVISSKAGTKAAENKPSPNTQTIIFYQSCLKYCTNSVSLSENFSFNVFHPPHCLAFIMTHEQIFKCWWYSFKFLDTQFSCFH